MSRFAIVLFAALAVACDRGQSPSESMPSTPGFCDTLRKTNDALAMRGTSGAVTDPIEADQTDVIQMRAEVARQTSVQARDCYNHIAGKRSDVAGQIDIAFTVDPSGTVQHVSVASNNTDRPELACCVAMTFAGIKLLPPAKTTRYKAPFRFRPVGAAKAEAK